jgi:DHA1 family inner membrane transport protein
LAASPQVKGRMAFFRNTTVNLLNLHYGMFALAAGGGGLFFGV